MRGVRPLRPGDPPSVGSYKVTGFLGEGGQGSVYLGVSAADERVAIKLLHARFAEDEQAVRRFRREAEAARRVAEFCTARVLEVGAVNDQPYIVGEYVDGPSLHHQVTKEGPIRGPALMRLAVTTATALVAIHRAGVVHRDFKPSNVLLGPDGPRVIDFGIARALDMSQSLTTSIVGTPAFMAPEQFLGEATGACDVFAWAGTMVFAATGRGAFGFGPLPVVMHRILQLDPDLTGVPEELGPLLWACLAKDPRGRPTAEQLLRDLIRSGSGPQAAVAGPPSPPAPAGRPVAPPYRTAPTAGRGRKVWIPVGAAAAAVLVGVTSWLVVRTYGAGTPTPGGATATASQAPGFGAAVNGIARPSAAKGGTVRVASTWTADSTDPGNMYLPDTLNIVRLYGRSLTMFKPAPGAEGTKIVPDLAESPGVPSDGGRTWTYRLRKGLKYADGSPVLAADVKHAVLRSMDPDFVYGSNHFDLMLDVPPDYKGPHESGDVDVSRAVETPDERTVVFHLKEPYATFDHVVSLPETVPVPESKDTRADYARNVLASGPYRLESVSDDRVVLVRNPQWDPATDPNRRALPDRYEIDYGLDAEPALDRVRNGQAEVGPTVGWDAMRSVLDNPALRQRADAPVTTGIRYLAINPQVPPFENVECRRAVVRALDLNALRTAYGGDLTGVPVPTSLLPPLLPGRRYADPNLRPGGDPAAARESLRACGKPTGFAARYIYRESLPGEGAAAEAVRSALAKVGISVSPTAFPVAEFHRSYGGNPKYLKDSGTGLIVKSWLPDWPDSESFLTYLADSDTIVDENSVNVSVRVKEIDDLMDRARKELDPARRADLWTQVERRLADEAVLVPLSWQDRLLLRGGKAANVHVSPVFGAYDLLSTGVVS